MIISVIPAKNNSRRLKNKNIRSLNKKPLIYWSIKAAINSKLFNKVIVSTNDKKIINIAKSLGAECPFIRSNNLTNEYINIYHFTTKFINLPGTYISFINSFPAI